MSRNLLEVLRILGYEMVSSGGCGSVVREGYIDVTGGRSWG
jgi:hypothetical protein